MFDEPCGHEIVSRIWQTRRWLRPTSDIGARKEEITPKGPPTVVVVETSQLSKANKVTAEKMLHNVGVLNRYVYDFKQTSILGWASVSAILCNIANIYLMYISLDSE